jgi:abortive infection bacteriophage resistance protein
MALIPYAKAHATPAQRIAHLRSKGLLVPRPNVAAQKIEAIGYERLRIYFHSRRQAGVPGKPFIPGTTYQDIIRLYECDSELRDLCFSAVGQFEVIFRNTLSEVVSRTYGSHPYYDHRVFKDASSNIKSLATFCQVFQKSKDHRAKHYRDTYSAPVMPPIWTMKEFLTFGAASHIYQSLEGSLRTAIAAEFGVPKDTVFTNWVECLVDLRNMCAHHDRIFNRAFQKQPRKLISASLPTAHSSKLKAILECLEYMLLKKGARTSITLEVRKALGRYPQISLAEAGY